MFILKEILGHDAPDKRKGWDTIIKQLHFQPVAVASVWSREIFQLSNLKNKISVLSFKPIKTKMKLFWKTQQSKNNPNWCHKVKKHKRFQFKNSEKLCGGFHSYRLHCSQDINDCTIKTLPIGQNVSQRVEISGILHWTVDQWHQPVDGCRVSTHVHLGMSFCYH